MTQKQRTGLLAVAIVSGLFLAAGCLVVALIVGNRDKGTDPASRPISEGNEKDDESYILGHRWWKKAPTQKRLDEIIRLVIDQNRGVAVVVDDTGATTIARYHDRDVGWINLDNDRIGKRRLFIDCTAATRPDRKKVLSEIRAELDFREYSHGPGR